MDDWSYHIAIYNKEPCSWSHTGEVLDYSDKFVLGEDFVDGYIIQPLFWMPLPEPPENKDG